MSTSMGRIKRLLIQIQEAQRLDADVLVGAIVLPAWLLEEPEDSPNRDRWILDVTLENAAAGTIRKLPPSYFDTKEEAMEAAAQIEAAHAPTGKKIATHKPYVVTMEEE